MTSGIVGSFVLIVAIMSFATTIGIPNAIIMRRLKYSWFWILLGLLFPFPILWFVALEIWPIEKKQIGTGNLRERVTARKA